MLALSSNPVYAVRRPDDLSESSAGEVAENRHASLINELNGRDSIENTSVFVNARSKKM